MTVNHNIYDPAPTMSTNNERQYLPHEGIIAFLDKHEIPKGTDIALTHQWFGKNKSYAGLHIKEEEYDKMAKLIYVYLNHLGPICFDDATYSELCLNERLDGTDRFILFIDIDFPLETFLDNALARDDTLPSLGISAESMDESKRHNGRYSVKKLWKNLTNVIKGIIQLAAKYYGEALANDHVIACQWPFRIHMYFPSIVVNEDMARRFRQMFTENPQVNAEWQQYFHHDSSIYDAAVYASGLRMIGCHKTGMIKMGDREKVLRKKRQFEDIFSVQKARDAYYPVDLESGEPLPWTPEIIRRCMIRKRRGCDLTQLLSGEVAEMNDETYRILASIAASPDTDAEPRVGRKVKVPNTVAWVEDKYNCKVATGIRILGNGLSDTKLVIPLNSYECKFENKTHAQNRQFLWITEKDATQRCFKMSCRGKTHHKIPASKYSSRVKEELREHGVLPRRGDNSTEIAPEKRIMENRMAQLKEVISSHRIMLLQGTGKTAPDDWFLPCYEDIRFLEKGLGCIIPLSHIYCPICDSPHDTPSNYVWLDKSGTMTVQCTHAVRAGRFLPESPIELDMFATRFILDLSVQPVDQVDRRMEGDDARILFEQGIYVQNDDELNQLLFNALSGYTQAIARVFLHVGKHRFRVTGANEWFEYNIQKGLWIGQRDISIPNYLDEVVATLFRDVRKYYTHQNDVDVIRRDKQIAQVTKIIDKLCDNKYRPGVVKDSQSLFRLFDNDFFTRLDQNPKLFAFNNGYVCDLVTFRFRPSMPEDWLSLSSEYEYQPYDQIPAESHQEVEDFFRSIMPRSEDRKYLLCLLASCLMGLHPDELMHFLQGNTRNGKGVLEHIILQTLGTYAATFAAVLLQQREQEAGKPDPLIINLFKCRVWTCNEVQNLTKLNNRTVKFLTGSPYISARLCHSNIIEKVRISPRIIMFCNDVPKMDVYDDATGRRLRILNLEITFTENPDPRKLYGASTSNEFEGSYEAKIDLGLKDRLGECRMAVFWKLLEYLKIYAKEGLKMTPSIMANNNRYEVESDPVKMWVVQKIRKTGLESNIVRLSEAYNDFSEWYKAKNRFPHPLITSAERLRINLLGERIGLDLRFGSIYGVQLVQEDL